MGVTKHKKLVIALLLYNILFYFVWSLCETWLKTVMPIAQNEWFREIFLKIVVWIIPALVFMRAYSESLAISFREVLLHRGNLVRYIPLCALFSVYVIVGALLRQSGLAFSPNFSLVTVVIVVFIGLGEELVFRGWLLNATLKLFGVKKKWLAISLNAVMFLCIHFPLWLYTGTFMASFVSFGFLAVLALSVIFSIVFIKSKSIWPAVALHAYWDLLMTVFL